MGNWSFYLYSGINGLAGGNTITFVRAKLEEGVLASSWSPAPEDAAAQIDRLIASIDG